jgi:hypothetical protein
VLPPFFQFWVCLDAHVVTLTHSNTHGWRRIHEHQTSLRREGVIAIRSNGVDQWGFNFTDRGGVARWYRPSVEGGPGALELEPVVITNVDGGYARAATVSEKGGAVEFTTSMWRRRRSSGMLGDASRL